MAKVTKVISGLEFEKTRDEWSAQRAFPHLLQTADGCIVIEDSAEPTPAQQAAIERFLLNEQAICDELLDTVVRCIKARRSESPDGFEGVPVIKSPARLGKVIEFQQLFVMRRECDGEALLGFSFSCDWDPEHGFGVAVHKGRVVDLGPADTASEPNGAFLPEGVLSPKQTAAWEKVFGQSVRDYQSQMRDAAAKAQEQRDRRLRQTAEGPQYGPAVREFTRLILEHPGLAMELTLDVAQPKPHISGGPADALRQLMAGLGGGADDPLPEVTAGMKNMVELAVNPPQPVVEVYLWLGGESASWKYSGQIRTDILQGGPWPGLLAALTRQWPGARPRLDSVAILQVDAKRLKQKPLKKSPLVPAARAALCELFHMDAPAAATAATDLLADLRAGVDGIARWNARSDAERRNGGPYKGADLTGSVLDGANLAGLEFQKARFDGARLRDARLISSKFNRATFRRAVIAGGETADARFKGCDFSEADLRAARFFMADLTKAKFDRADLRGAVFSMCKVQGADFSTARLEGAEFFNWTEFDETTSFPADFPLPADLQWSGDGPDPRGPGGT